MADKYVAANTYSFAEQLALWEECLVVIAVTGQEYQVGDRIFKNADVKEVEQIVLRLTRWVNRDANSGPSEVIARKGRFNC